MSCLPAVVLAVIAVLGFAPLAVTAEAVIAPSWDLKASEERLVEAVRAAATIVEQADTRRTDPAWIQQSRASIVLLRSVADQGGDLCASAKEQFLKDQREREKDHPTVNAPRRDFRGVEPVRFAGLHRKVTDDLVRLATLPVGYPLTITTEDDIIIKMDDPADPFQITMTALEVLFTTGWHDLALSALATRTSQARQEAEGDERQQGGSATALMTPAMRDWRLAWRQARAEYQRGLLVSYAGLCWNDSAVEIIRGLAAAEPGVRRRLDEIERHIACGRDPLAWLNKHLGTGTAPDGLHRFAWDATPAVRRIEAISSGLAGSHARVMPVIAQRILDEISYQRQPIDISRGKPLTDAEIVSMAYCAAELVEAYRPDRFEITWPRRPGRLPTADEAEPLFKALSLVVDKFGPAIEYATNNATPKIAATFTQRGLAIGRAVETLGQWAHRPTP